MRPTKSSGGHVENAIVSSRLQHSQHFRDGNFRPGRKNMAEFAQNNIEFHIAKRQLLDVTFMPLHFGARDVRILPRPFQQFRSEIEPRNARAQPRLLLPKRRQCRRPRPARSVPSELLRD